MKYFYYRLISIVSGKPYNQAGLLDFINNKRNIEKAVEGSMQKRLDLMKRVELRKNVLK